MSTRDGSPDVGFSEAITAGLAPDGGLFSLERIPQVKNLPVDDYPAFAAAVLAPYADGDALASELPTICRAAFNFDVVLKDLGSNTALLELYHGPTSAFKDFGARFLAAALSRIPSPKPRLVLVATSGDTGGAVAAAFHEMTGFEVAVLFPQGRVSPRQEHQLTAWGGNVHPFAVRGAFDDCQRIVKEAFAQPARFAGKSLISANSINLGRLLPQVVYHAWSAATYVKRHGAVPGLIIPSGNLGNGVAAEIARRMGFPIREILFAVNENRAVPDFLDTGVITPRPTLETPANAMDVGAPSNLERLRKLGIQGAPLSSISVSNDEILDAVARVPKIWKQVVCPHTACGFVAREKAGRVHWIISATAHPAKFETIVEPRIGGAVEIPPRLASLLAKPSVFKVIEPNLESLLRLL